MSVSHDVGDQPDFLQLGHFQKIHRSLKNFNTAKEQSRRAAHSAEQLSQLTPSTVYIAVTTNYIFNNGSEKTGKYSQCIIPIRGNITSLLCHSSGKYCDHHMSYDPIIYPIWSIQPETCYGQSSKIIIWLLGYVYTAH